MTFFLFQCICNFRSKAFEKYSNTLRVVFKLNEELLQDLLDINRYIYNNSKFMVEINLFTVTLIIR